MSFDCCVCQEKRQIFNIINDIQTIPIDDVVVEWELDFMLNKLKKVIGL